MIKNRMNSRKVLIILDDIDEVYQLDALVGGSHWLGLGSLIIITTTNRKVLEIQGDTHIYKLDGLTFEQSSYLFKLYAFKDREPEKGCRQLLDAFVKGGGGIPLALQVIGSILSSKREVQEWNYILEKLKSIPKDSIQQRLRISYDELKEEEQKQIFLDISCFFIGKDREKATRMWKACDFYPECAVPNLLSRSLIDIDQHGEFSMHDLIRDMGREIVRQEGATEPWMRSRLWSSQDIFDLLRRTVANEHVKGIMLPKSINDFDDTDGSSLQNKVTGQSSNLEKCFSAQCFELMHSLRILHLEGISFEGNFQHFPKGLKWLALENCRFSSPPPDFDLEKVAVLDMSGCSLLAECFTNNSLVGKLVLSNLKFVSLARTEISSTPDFTNVHCLQQLIFRDCTKLTKVDESIGVLTSLLSLDLGGCEVLSKIPDSIYRLSSLKSFDLRKCCKVSSLPESLGNMKLLEKLYLDSTSIETLPDSIGSLTRLGVLSLKGCKCLNALPGSLRNLLCLQHLIVQDTFIKGRRNDFHYKKETIEVTAISIDLLCVLPNILCRRVCTLSVIDHTTKELPDSVRHMTNLSSLFLYCKALRELPAYIGSLRRIERLRLRCWELQSLPNSLGGLKDLVSFDIFSQSMESLPDLFGGLESLAYLDIDCSRLTSLPHSIGHLENLRTLLLRCNNLEDLPSSINYLGSLQYLSLRCCRNLKKLSLAPIPQQDSLHYSFVFQPLLSKRPEQGGQYGSLRQLCSSLVYLEASHCTQLGEINISGLQQLRSLDLEGSDLLEDIHGLEFISNTLNSLVLSPSCALNGNFNERSFKKAVFPYLSTFAVKGTRNIRPRSFFRGTILPALTKALRLLTRPFGVKDILQQTESTTPAMPWVPRGHLALMLPSVPHAANRCLIKAAFTFDGLISPILISVIADDGSLAFEDTRHLVGTSLTLLHDDEIILRLRDIASASIKVTADMSKLTKFSAAFEWTHKGSRFYTSQPHHFSFST